MKKILKFLIGLAFAIVILLFFAGASHSAETGDDIIMKPWPAAHPYAHHAYEDSDDGEDQAITDKAYMHDAYVNHDYEGARQWEQRSHRDEGN